MWLLASNPDAQTRLRHELDEHCLPDDLGDAALHHLPYLSAVIYESLRLFPPIPTSFREALVDTRIDEVFVPKGKSPLRPAHSS